MTKACELLPCPFCGGEPKSYWQGDSSECGDDGYWAVECCHVHVHQDDEAEAITAWNTRSPSPTREAVLEEAKDIYEQGFFAGSARGGVHPPPKWEIEQRWQQSRAFAALSPNPEPIVGQSGEEAENNLGRCPECGAPPGLDCRTIQGRTQPHGVRLLLQGGSHD